MSKMSNIGSKAVKASKSNSSNGGKKSSSSSSSGKNKYKSSSTSSYKNTNKVKNAYKQYKSGGSSDGSNYMYRQYQQAKRYEEGTAKKKNETSTKEDRKTNRRGIVQTAFDVLSAGSALTEPAVERILTGQSVRWKDVKAGGSNAWNAITTGKYKTGSSALKYSKDYARKHGYNSVTDIASKMYSGYTGADEEKTFNTMSGITGVGVDIATDPLTYLGGVGAMKVLKGVVKGSGSGVKGYGKLAKGLKVADEIVDGKKVTRTADEITGSTENIAKAHDTYYWTKKAEEVRVSNTIEGKKARASQTSPEEVMAELRKNPVYDNVSDEELYKKATDTVTSFRKGIGMNTDIEEATMRMNGYTNVGFDKARSALQSAKIKTLRAATAIGDSEYNIVSTAYNNMANAIKNNRLTQKVSKQSEKQATLRRLIESGETTSTKEATKKLIESGILKSAGEEETLQTAMKIEAMYKDMTPEEQLEVTKNYEDGLYSDYSKEKGEFVTGKSREETLETVSNLKETIKKHSKYTPEDYVQKSYTGKVVNESSTDEEILDAKELLDTTGRHEDYNIQKTFNACYNDYYRYRDTNIVTDREGMEGLYNDRVFQNAITIAKHQIETGQESAAKIAETFFSRLSAEQREMLLKRHGVFGEEQQKTIVEMVEGEEVVVHALEGEVLKSWIKRGANDYSKGGALETAYNAIKEEAMRAETMSLPIEDYKDAKDLVELVEEKKAMLGNGTLEGALRSLSPDQRKIMLQKYVEVKKGMEDLYSRIEGKSALQRAKEMKKMEDIGMPFIEDESGELVPNIKADIQTEAPKVAEETTKGKFTPTLTLEENDVAKYAPEENETYYYTNMQINAYRTSLNKMKDPSSPQYQKHAKALEEKLKIKQYIEGVAMQNKQAALAKGTEVATKVDDVAEAAVKEAPTPKKVEKVEAPSQPKAEAPKESKGVEVTVKFLGGKTDEQKLKELSLESDMEEEIASTIREWDRAGKPEVGTIIAEKTGADYAERATLDISSLSEADKATISQVEEFVRLMTGKKDFKIGTDTEELLTDSFKEVERAVERHYKAKGYYEGNENALAISELFSKEMEKVFERDHELGYISEEKYREIKEAGFSRYIEHIETEDYKNYLKNKEEMSMKLEEGFDEGELPLAEEHKVNPGAYDSAYSGVAKKFNQRNSGSIGDVVKELSDAGQREIQKFETNLAMVYLQRSIISNEAIYSEASQRFLRENFTRTIEGTAEGITKAYSELGEDECVGIIHADLQQLISGQASSYRRNAAKTAARKKVTSLKKITDPETGEVYERLKNLSKKEVQELNVEFVQKLSEIRNGKVTKERFAEVLNKAQTEYFAKTKNASGIFEEMQTRIWQAQQTNYTSRIEKRKVIYEYLLKETKNELAATIRTMPTPFDSDFKAASSRLAKAREVGTEEQINTAIEEFNKVYEQSYQWLLANNEDFGNLLRGYEDYETIQDTLKEMNAIIENERAIERFKNSEITEEELTRLIEKKYSEEYGSALYNGVNNTLLEHIFDGDTNRIGLFTGNIPMQELTQEQAMRIAKLYGKDVPLVRMSKTVMNETNTMSRAQQLSQQSDLRKLTERLMSIHKMNNTITSPAFHINNAVGNTVQSFYANGAKALNPENVALAHSVIKGNSPDTMVRVGSTEITQRALQRELIDMDIMSDIRARSDIGDVETIRTQKGTVYQKTNGSYTRGSLYQSPSPTKTFTEVNRYNGRLSGLNKIDNKLSRAGSNSMLLSTSQAVGSNVESVQRASLYISLRKEGIQPMTAKDIVNDYMFDYNELTEFEQKWLRNIVPFYTYTRKNIPMHVKVLLNNPQRVTAMAHVEESMNNGTFGTLPAEYRTYYGQDYIGVPGTNAGVNLQLPIQNALAPFNVINKDMQSEDYGQVTPSSVLNQAVGIVNNPIGNLLYTGITGNKPRVLDSNAEGMTAESWSNAATNLIGGALGSNFMPAESETYGGGIVGCLINRAQAKHTMNTTTSRDKYIEAQKQLEKAEKEFVKQTTKYLFTPVDTNMYDTREWKPNEVKYTNSKGKEVTMNSYLTQEQFDKLYDEYQQNILTESAKKGYISGADYTTQMKNYGGGYVTKYGNEGDMTGYIMQSEEYLMDKYGNGRYTNLYNNSKKAGRIPKNMTFEQFIAKFIAPNAISTAEENGVY